METKKIFCKFHSNKELIKNEYTNKLGLLVTYYKCEECEKNKKEITDEEKYKKYSECLMGFGKYKSCLVTEVIKKDKNYIEYILELGSKKRDNNAKYYIIKFLYNRMNN